MRCFPFEYLSLTLPQDNSFSAQSTFLYIKQTNLLCACSFFNAIQGILKSVQCSLDSNVKIEIHKKLVKSILKCKYNIGRLLLFSLLVLRHV